MTLEQRVCKLEHGAPRPTATAEEYFERLSADPHGNWQDEFIERMPDEELDKSIAGLQHLIEE